MVICSYFFFFSVKDKVFSCQILKKEVVALHELRIILEDIRNQLTIAKGFVQLKKAEDPMYQELLLTPINNVDRLTEEALAIIELSRYQKYP